MAGYRRFVAYVYEYPDGKKGNGKGFIKVEARDGKCRMNYRITGIYGREEAPCKIYGFVRKEEGCEGIYLGECDLAGDTVQFQTEVPEQGLGGTVYALNDLSGLIMLTGDGIMYGTGWDDKPVRLEEIHLPKMQEASSRIADRTAEREKSVRKEDISGRDDEKLPEGVAAQALMEAETATGDENREENRYESSGYYEEEQDDLPREDLRYSSNTNMGGQIYPPNADMGEVLMTPDEEMDEEVIRPGAGADERVTPRDTGMDRKITPRNVETDDQIVPPNTGIDDQIVPPNTGIDDQIMPPNTGIDDRIVPPNTGIDDRIEPPNTDMDKPAVSLNSDTWQRNADWEEPAYPQNADRGGNDASRNADWEEPSNPQNADRGNAAGTPGGRKYMPSQTGGDPYMPPHINERGTYIPPHYSEEERPIPRQGTQTGRDEEPAVSPETENTVQPALPPAGAMYEPETERNFGTVLPDMEMMPYTEEELYRETINNKIFGNDQQPNGGMRIEAAGDEDAGEKSTWNPEGENEADEINLLEELDQDEDAIRNMREMEKEVSKKNAEEPEAGELHEQSAQAARQPAVFAPFSDGEIVDCRQITPAELRILARRDRGLMNNNFLRHGYYRYHHLLLGRRRDDGRYILGVPGVYDRQECLMAGMFGFPNFKAAKTQGKATTPRFGYWYRLIDTPDVNRRNRS